MRFSEATKEKACLGQWGRCGRCGESLEGKEDFAHPIIPDLLGGRDRADNCVILCGSCQNWMHREGGSRSGIVAPRSYFAFAKGDGR
jgi:5-methylcytosine-specific restriction endonuclease McrA